MTSPIEEAMKLVVWGPYGAVLAVKDALPEWVQRGRLRAREQFANARALGELATDYGQKVVTAKLVGIGILPGPPPPARGGAGVAVPQVSGPDDSATTVDDADGAADDRRPANGRVSQPRSVLSDPGGATPGPADLSIPGYDSLSASQVVSRLAGLAPGELEAVRTYEAATRGRRTILTKIVQLQTGRA